ncbi:MAG: outer membrane protein assembly factor BamA [Chthoniobacterales bacterium]
MRYFSGMSGGRFVAVALVCIAALCGAILPAHAQQQAVPQGPPIVKAIDVEYSGPATVSKERILAQLRTAVGQPYSDEVVEADIRQLYSLGVIKNVRIFAQNEGTGVKVIVAVQTRSVVREIEIDGAERVGAKRLRKELEIKMNQPANEEALEKGRQKMIDVYRSKGFNDVSIQYRVDPIDESRGISRIVFTVNEGVQAAVKSIKFEGNQHFSDSVLRKQMKTKRQTPIALLDKSGRLDEVQLQQDLDSIKEFYQNNGYIDAEVKDVRKEHGTKSMALTIAVNEGIQYHVGRLSITGEKVSTEEKIRALLKMKEGDVYSPKQLHDDAKAVADGYGAGGFVDLVITPEGVPAGQGLINLHYKVEEGARSFVERINIVGNTRTKDKVLRREVLVSPGDVYNTVRVDVSKKRLENLGYFANVETYPEDSGVPGRKDLTIQVQEKRTGSLSFGGGFSTIDSLLFFVELQQGNFDITNWPGLTGGGQKFRLRLQAGTQRKDIILALTEPYFLDRRISLGGQAFFSEADYLSSVYNQRDYGFSIETRKPLTPFMYATLNYRLENIDIYDVAAGTSPEITAEQGTNSKSQIGGSLVWDHRDSPLLTRTGQRISITPYIAGGFLGGDTQTYGWDVEGSQFFHLPKDLIFFINAEAAVVDVWGGESQTRLVPANNGTTTIRVPSVPIYDRLYLGGSNNLRGFAFRDVGPRDKNGEPLGGQSMARITGELSFPIIKNVRGAMFYDTGILNVSPYDWNTDQHFASDAGLGLRLDLPIGPLRIDYGIPIQKDGRGNQGHINFNVGYQF